MSSDLVAVWDVALSDGVHQVEFEHGTTSGKRVIRVDRKVFNTYRILPNTRASPNRCDPPPKIWITYLKSVAQRSRHDNAV